MAFPGQHRRLPDEPVITAQEDHRRLPMMLLGMLQLQRADLVEMLAKGRSLDFPAYKFACGQIDGLDIAINFAQQAQKKLEA